MDNHTITYDAIGNPTSYYNGTQWTFGWSNGRRLTSASGGGNTLSYTYDADGIRTSKTVNGTEHVYYYAGGKLLRETYGNNTLDFFYDVNGNPYALKYNNTLYYYITNLQGDVMYIVNGSGQEVAAYTYDPYGNVLTASGSMAEVNPLRYRGYYYDSESGLYYLQSRYYDPELGRFINADAFTSTGQGLLSNNMFAYCLNNPVNGYDSLGMWTITFSFGFDMTLFFFGLAISLGIAVDDNGNLAIQGSYCEPNYLNDNKTYYVGLADIGTTGSFQWTDDDTIFDLEGPGTYVGGSAGVAQYFSADLVYSGVTADDENGDALPNGFQINYGFGLGIDVHYRQTQTETICVIFGG